VTQTVDVDTPGAAPPPERGGASRHAGQRQSLLSSLHLASFLRTAAPLLAIIIGLSLYTNGRNSAFLTSGNIQDILGTSAVLGVLAIGQTFLLVGGQLDLSVGSIVSFIGVLGAKEYANGWSTPAVIAVSLLIGALVGLIWGLVVTSLRVPPFILTLGGLGIFSSLALVIADNRPIPMTSALTTLGFGDFLGVRASASVMFAVAIVAIVLLHFTRFGRSAFALGSSPQAAYLAGVPTKRLTIMLFVLNSMLASLAGIVLMARLAAGDPRGGAGLELSAIAAIVLGGAAQRGVDDAENDDAEQAADDAAAATGQFLNIAGAWQNLVSGGILVAAVTLTAAADVYSAQRSGGQRTSRLQQISSRLLSRPPKPT